MFIEKVVKALQKHNVYFALVGGFAVALHGVLRGTIDIDIILQLTKNDFLSAEAALKELGLTPRLPVSAAEIFEFRKEYIQNRNLIAWSFVNPSNPIELVDIIITEEKVRPKIVSIPMGNVNYPVLVIKDLIAMKKRSGRPQDLADIAALENLKK